MPNPTTHSLHPWHLPAIPTHPQSLPTHLPPPHPILGHQVLAQLDAAGSPRGRLQAALRGVFAGNIFDLGAAATAAAYQDAGGVDFRAVLEKLLPRPWVRDRGGGQGTCGGEAEGARWSRALGVRARGGSGRANELVSSGGTMHTPTGSWPVVDRQDCRCNRSHSMKRDGRIHIAPMCAAVAIRR
jgi:hypothetical protein